MSANPQPSQLYNVDTVERLTLVSTARGVRPVGDCWGERAPMARCRSGKAVGFFCDWPSGTRTCSVPMCPDHRTSPRVGADLCSYHTDKWHTNLNAGMAEFSEVGRAIVSKPGRGKVHLRTARCVHAIYLKSTTRFTTKFAEVTCTWCRQSSAAERCRAYVRPSVRADALVFFDWLAENGLEKKAPKWLSDIVDRLADADAVDYRAVLAQERDLRGPLVEVTADLVFGDERVLVMEMDRLLSGFSVATQEALEAKDLAAQLALFGPSA